MHSINFKYIQIIFCLLASLLVAGCAGTPAPKWTPPEASIFNKPLTLETCLELANKNDIRVAQWKARMDIARAGLSQSRTLPNPSLGISWEDIGLKDAAGASIASVTYGISYPVLFWWSRGLKIKAAKINQLSEEAAIHSEQRQLEIEVASAYFNLVADQRKAELTKDISKSSSEAFRLAQKQSGQNDISGFSLEQARLEMTKSESDYKEAQSTLRADQLSFAFAMGADRPFYPVVVDCEDRYLQAEGVSSTDEILTEEVLKSAVEKDPDYIQKRLATNYAAVKLGIEKWNVIPFADAVGSAGKKDSPEGDSKTYSLDIAIPLFDWNRAGIKTADAELRTAQADEEKARRDAIAAITIKWDQYRTLSWKWEQYSNNSNQLAEKNIETASRLYDMGRISYRELLQSQRDYKNVQMQAVEDWSDLCKASWKLSLILDKR
jgi:outer membrane protein, heavy metal efflux system